MDDEGVERLSQYIIRAPISQERIVYIPEDKSKDGVARVVYKGKTSRTSEIFTALDWLARLVTHIPNKGEQVVDAWKLLILLIEKEVLNLDHKFHKSFSHG